MGFFTAGEISKKAKIKVNPEQLQAVCLKCQLYKQCNSPKIKLSGEGRKKILIISEFPSYVDDNYNSILIGDEGRFLGNALREINISLNRDCWKIHAVCCKPPGGRIPSHKEIKCCYPNIEKTIRTLKPKLVLLLGNIAITSLFGEDFSNRKIDRWRAYEIPDEKFKCYIMCVYAPYYILKNEKDKNLHSVFKRDIKRVSHCLKLTYPKQINYEEYVTILRDFKAVKTILNRILKRKQKITFDYETTGLKPFREGHKIVSIGLAVSSKKAFAFPFDYKSYWTKAEFIKIKSLWKQILLNREIKKICHNVKFEDLWSTVRMGVRPINWHWDTMMGAHIMDNRHASTGLKFQTFVYYGIRPYDKIISPFLKSKDGEFNTVETAPFKELLIYNGLDCIYSFMRYNDQKAYLPHMKNMFKAYKFFMRGTQTMSTLQLNGINMNMKHYKNTANNLKNRISKLKNYLLTGREAKKFKQQFGRGLNITSNPDLGKLFFEVLGKEPIRTEKGNYKTDKQTLEKLNLPFVDKLSEMKRLEKAKGTYLAQFARETYKKQIHPFFDLHIPVSYRGSASMPSFQNLPKRDPEIGNLVRKGIIPRQNSVLGELDFSGAEVITSLTYHHDPQFKHDITVGDMHRDLAIELFKLPFKMMNKACTEYTKEQIKRIKKIRFFAKNSWTFAQFYGDWFGSCAPTLWENVVEAGLKLVTGQTVQEWLEGKGIYELGDIVNGAPTQNSFMEHCKHVEDQMWNERFPVYTQWKKDIVEFYQKYGFIETHLGFRFQGYMNKKQCTNFPIQGTSFHLLLYTLIKVERFIKKNKLKTKLIGQIHDSIILDMPKNEIVFVITGVNNIVKNLQTVFKWLTLPMKIEIELSRLKEYGGNFAEMQEFSITEITDGSYKSYLTN